MLALDAPVLAVFVLSSVAVAAATLYAPTSGQALLWTAALVPWAGILVWRGADPLWLAGLTAGAVAGLACGIVQAAFAGVFYAHHPDQAPTSGLATWGTFVGFALVAGTVWGLLSAGIAWGVRRLV